MNCNDQVLLKQNLEKVCQFIQSIESQNPEDSPYQIANLLHQYTQISVREELYEWEILSGKNFLVNGLNLLVLMSDRVVNFGHFITALSNAISLAGLSSVVDFTTFWNSKYNCWAAELAQACQEYRDQKFTNIEDAITANCCLANLTANVAAVRVGDLINSGLLFDSRDLSQPKYRMNISTAIFEYNQTSYITHLQEFIKTELGGILVDHTLINPDQVETSIRLAIAEALNFRQLREHKYKFNQNQYFLGNSRAIAMASLGISEIFFNGSEAEVKAVSLDFFQYLLGEAQLKNLQFQKVNYAGDQTY